jgi:hypothetical protein
MTSFKLAAIKVLRDGNEPLHYKEITKRALEEAFGLVKPIIEALLKSDLAAVKQRFNGLMGDDLGQ